MNKKGVIADTIHGNILLTDFERKIMSHVTFNRLHDVYQNSTVYMTFPCNRTKRFEHSLGTMKLCSDMFSSAVSNTESAVAKEFLYFYSKELLEIISEIKNKKFRDYGLALGGRVKKVNEKKLPEIKEKYASFIPPSREIKEFYTTYFILIQSIRISALLHDVGHPPYSHITEFALENVRNKYKNCCKNSRIREFNEIMDSFYGKDDKKLHEKMGDKIVTIILEDSIDSISEKEANTNSEIFNRQVIHILTKEVVQKILSNEKPFDCLHRIIDGTLDGDRLDYVTRDALNSGLDKGSIEYERLFNSMVIAKYEDEYWICPSIKSLNTVEDFLNRRWDIYKNIIFHHRVIKTDYLLQSVIQQISIEYLENNIYEAENEVSIDLLPSNISGLWKALKDSTNTESSYAISQWDDAWLMTVLKKHYFKDYIDSGKDEIVKNQLEELLTNKKHYFSVIKRLEDFLVIDNAISAELIKREKELMEKIKELRELSRDYKGEDSGTITIDPFLNGVEKILSLSKAIDENQTFQGLIFSHLKKLYDNIYDEQTDIETFLADIIQKSKVKFHENSVEDVFVVMKKYDIGIKKPLLLYNDNQEKVVSIHEISSVARILDLSFDMFPQFFIYVLKTDKFKDEIIDTREFLKGVGIEIAVKFYNCWIEILNKNITKFKQV